MRIHAWIQNGLLFLVRVDEDKDKQEHAVFTANGHIVWIPNGQNGEIQAMMDIEKFQINEGLPWPPTEPPVAL